MTPKEQKEFDRGYLLACAAIVNAHGEVAVAADVLNASDIKRSDIPGFDLTEYDATAINMVLADPRCIINE